MPAAAERRAHWAEVWAENAPDEVSWHQARPDLSLRLLRGAGVGPGARVLDAGGGASTLVDHLLDEGQREVAVVDIAPQALERAKARLGPRAARVQWIVADLAAGPPLPPCDAWHDRAVFHFLTEPAERAGYLAALRSALAPGGVAVLATFAPDGPETCSGLPVQRWDAEGLARELGPGFTLERAEREAHTTPWATEQRFQYAVLRRRSA